MSAYYASINSGAFIAIASTLAEKYVGFWLAFLIPGIICLVMPFLLTWIRSSLAPSPPPAPSPLLDALSAFSETSVSTFAENDPMVQKDKQSMQGLMKLFLFFAVYNVADSGLQPIFTSLAGSMTTNVRGLAKNDASVLKPRVSQTTSCGTRTRWPS